MKIIFGGKKIAGTEFFPKGVRSFKKSLKGKALAAQDFHYQPDCPFTLELDSKM